MRLGTGDGGRLLIDDETGDTSWQPGNPTFDRQHITWSFRTGSREVRDGEEFRFAGMDRPTPLQARITFSCAEPSLELTVLIELDEPGLKAMAWIVNRSPTDIALGSIHVLEFIPAAAAPPFPWRMLVDSGRYTSCGVRDLTEPLRSNMVTLLCSAGLSQAFLVGFLSNRTAENWIYVQPDSQSKAIGRIEAVAEDPGRLAPGDVWMSDPVRLAIGADPLALLEGFGDEVRRTVLPPLPARPLAGFLTWYGYGTGVTEDRVLQAARSTSLLLDGYEQDMEAVVLLDHGWTRNSRLGDWQTPDSPAFPHGMKWLSDRLHESGMTLGLWYTPFFVTADAEEYGSLQGLYCRGVGDRPVTVNAAIWPEGSRPMQLLDSSLEKSRIRNEQDLAAMNLWGVGLWKVDFFTVHSSLKRSRDWPACRLNSEVWASLRNRIDAGDLIMPCTSFTNLHLGHCSLMNVSLDVGSAGHWPATLPAFRTVLSTVSASWFKHENFWMNDIQSVQLGGGNAGEARVRATMAACSGAGFWWSDEPDSLPPDRLVMLQHCLPVYGHAARPVTLFAAPGSEDEPVVWSLAVESDWAGSLRTVAVFNLGEEPRPARIEPEWFGVAADSPLMVMEWWQSAYLDADRAPFVVDVPPMDALVLHATPIREHPWIVSTDLHYAPTWILQGVRWLTEDNALVGEVVTRAGLRGHIYGFAPTGWAPKGGIMRDRASYGFRAWSVEVETSGPRTPFRIVFEPDTEPR